MGNSWEIAWCHAGDAGGSKRAAFEMIRELSRRGHVIDEFIIRDGEPNLNHFPVQPFIRSSFLTIFQEPNVKCRPYLLELWVNLARTTWKNRDIRLALQRLARQINEGGYDIVHIDQVSYCKAILLLPRLRVPTIVYSHEASKSRYYGSLGDSQDGQAWTAWRLYKRVCDMTSRFSQWLRDRHDISATRHAKTIVSNSCYTKETFFQRYGRLATVCPYGVDTETFRPLSLNGERMVLSVGRLVRAKQHHLVIEAVGRIDKSRRPRVIIATPEDSDRRESPIYSEWLERLAQERGVELEVRVNPSQSELVRLYNQAIALIFVPIMEPFGLVALEAMACGTPVIGIREAGIRESVIDGVTGVLLERNVDQICAAVEQLQRCEDIRARLGRQAIEYARTQWTWERTIDRYEDEVRRILSTTSTSSSGTYP